MGVMQLMPSTAQAMARNIKLPGSTSMAEPAVSMALGQQYLKQLMEAPNVQNNLVFLLASYNAGPVAVEKWQQQIVYNKDPLLFVESIPYAATRDYVVNVIGSYWVYGDLFGDAEHGSVAMISQGEWPLY